jgi:predicted O-methyltransferase YrrM
MNRLIEHIYATGRVIGKTGRVHELNSAIGKEKGEFLYSIIKNDSTISKTLEVGCAFGLSSLYICEATRDRAGTRHTIIDPHENTIWDGAGPRNLQQVGVEYVELIERGSEIALPQLMTAGKGPYDFIFIDGWHTFDHTLIDCFYATRLLRVGGVLALDDVDWDSVGRVVDFLLTYPCYEDIGRVTRARPRGWKGRLATTLAAPVGRENVKRLVSHNLYRRIFDDRYTRMIALRKQSEDTRTWTWHSDAI